MILHFPSFHFHREPASTGGREARVAAERELARIQAMTPYYEGLGQDVKRLRNRNHFAENIRATIRRT